MGKLGLMNPKTRELENKERDAFRKTNWQEKLSDFSPYEPGWFGRAYTASMYSSIAQCVSYVKHIAAPLQGGAVVPTAVTTLDDADGGGMDPSEMKVTSQVPYQTLLEVQTTSSSSSKSTSSVSVKEISFVGSVVGSLRGSKTARQQETAARHAVADVKRAHAAAEGDWLVATAKDKDPVDASLVEISDAVDGLVKLRIVRHRTGGNSGTHRTQRTSKDDSGRWNTPTDAAAKEDGSVDSVLDIDTSDDAVLVEEMEGSGDAAGDVAGDATGDVASGGERSGVEMMLLQLKVDSLVQELAEERRARNVDIRALEKRMEQRMGAHTQMPTGNTKAPAPRTAPRRGGVFMQTGETSRQSMRMKKGFDMGFSKITEWIEEKISAFSKAVIDPMRSALEKLIKEASKFLEGMIKQLEKGLDKVKRWLEGLIKQVEKQIMKIVDEIKKVIDKIKEALEKAKNWLKGLLDKLKQAVMSLIDKIKEALEKAKQWLKKLIDELKKKVLKLVNAIKKELDKVANWLKGLVDKLKAAIMKVVNDVVKLVKGWVDKALSFVKKIKDFFLNLVKKAFAAIKGLWNKVMELWEKIKELPALIYGWIQKGIGAVIGLVGKVLQFFGDTKTPMKIAEQNCKMLKNVIIVWDICFWFFAVTEMIVGKMMDLGAIVVDFAFGVLKKTAAKSGFTINFGTLSGASKVCIKYRKTLPFSMVFNLPIYWACHAVAHAQIAVADLLDIILTYITKLTSSSSIPKWDGRPLLGARGIEFGSKAESLEACQGFMSLLATMKIAPFPTGIVCLIDFRMTSGIRSIADTFFEHARAVTTIPFYDRDESARVCESLKKPPFSTFGGSITHKFFVACTIYAQLIPPVEFAAHWLLDQLSNLFLDSASKATLTTTAAAKTMCAWKHWALLLMHGLAWKAWCGWFIRFYDILFTLWVMIWNRFLDLALGPATAAQQSIFTDAKAGARANCARAAAKLMSWPFIKELPVNPLFAFCPYVVQIPHIIGLPFIRLVQKISSSAGSSFLQLSEEGGSGSGAGDAAGGILEKIAFPDPLPNARKMSISFCKILEIIPGVYDLCKIMVFSSEVVVGTILSFYAWAVHFVFKAQEKIINIIPGVNVNFGTMAESEAACTRYRGSIPLSGIFNLPGYVFCHVVVHLLGAYNDILDYYLSRVSRLTALVPQPGGPGGAKFFGAKGMDFGTKAETLAACKGFLSTLAFLKQSAMWSIPCLFLFRSFVGLNSFYDGLFAWARVVIGIPFVTAAESRVVCSFWRSEFAAKMGGFTSVFFFWLCAMMNRVVGLFEWSFHFAWDQLSNLLQSDTFTAAAAKKMCLWKHWAVMGYVTITMIIHPHPVLCTT